jgi:hypothetical protein
MKKKVYNQKESYILRETAKKLYKGEILCTITDIVNTKIYLTILDKDYEITIREMS